MTTSEMEQRSIPFQDPPAPSFISLFIYRTVSHLQDQINSVEATYLIKSPSPHLTSYHILSVHSPSRCLSLPVDSNQQHPKCLKSTSILLSTVSNLLTSHRAMTNDQTPPLAESSSSFTTMSSPRLLRTSGLSALERRVSSHELLT